MGQRMPAEEGEAPSGSGLGGAAQVHIIGVGRKSKLTFNIQGHCEASLEAAATMLENSAANGTTNVKRGSEELAICSLAGVDNI